MSKLKLLNIWFFLLPILAWAQVENHTISRKNSMGQTADLFYTLYLPENQEAKASMLILHGMQEHSGRYKAVAEYFANQGFAVLTYDHIGHGKTAQSREELGYFQAHKPDKQLVSDTKLMAEQLENLYPNLPKYIMGHSMGSFITRVFLQENYQDFDGAIIVGTGAKVPGIGFFKTYLAVKNTFNPKKRSSFVNRTFSNMNNKKFKNQAGADATSWLSANPENRAAFEKDSSLGVPFTNNGFYTLIKINQKATKRNWAKKIDKDFPILFVSGAEDPIGDFGKGIIKTTSHLEKKGFSEIQAKLYPNLRHEVLNESIKEEVYDYILNWINQINN